MIMTDPKLPAFTHLGESIIFFYDNVQKHFPNLHLTTDKQL